MRDRSISKQRRIYHGGVGNSANSVMFSFHSVNFKVITDFCSNRMLFNSQDLMDSDESEN